MAAPTSIKLFNKWSFEDVTVADLSLKDYIAIDKQARPAPLACNSAKQRFVLIHYKHASNPDQAVSFLPHSAGRWQKKRFRKAQCPIVERLTNAIMMKGRNNGKKAILRPRSRLFPKHQIQIQSHTMLYSSWPSASSSTPSTSSTC